MDQGHQQSLVPGTTQRNVLLLETCWYCRRTVPRAQRTREHRLPACRGGTNSLRNVTMACRDCNSAKGPLTEAEFWLVSRNPEALRALIKVVGGRLSVGQPKKLPRIYPTWTAMVRLYPNWDLIRP